MEEKILIKAEFSSLNFLFIIPLLPLVPFFNIIVATNRIMLFAPFIAICVFLFLVVWIIKKILEKREIIVTNKRVIARGAFGQRLDIPIEKITNVSMYWFNGIGCGSPSSKIRFHLCKNKTEIFDTIISESLQRDSKYK